MTASEDSLRLVHAIACEDIRTEVNHKHTLVGVISGDILVQEFPASIRLAVYCELEVPHAGQIPVQLRLFYADKDLARTRTRVESPQAGPAVLVVQSFTLNAPHAGIFKVEISTDGATWKTVVQRSISAGTIPLLPLTSPPAT